jgi:hypothetical protein
LPSLLRPPPSGYCSSVTVALELGPVELSKLTVDCVGARRAHIFSIHIGAAGSQAATAFCTTASTTLRGGHLALTVGFLQMDTTPKEWRGDHSEFSLRAQRA